MKFFISCILVTLFSLLGGCRENHASNERPDGGGSEKAETDSEMIADLDSEGNVCSSCDGDVDGDMDADSDMDTGGDVVTDSDVVTDNGAGSDSDSDMDGDSDGDADGDSDIDTDTDADTDTNTDVSSTPESDIDTDRNSDVVTNADTDSKFELDADSSTDDPAGYHRIDDWHGCSWTRKDDLKLGDTDDEENQLTSITSISPNDFVDKTSDEYCISGTVGDNTAAFAALGFNIAEPEQGADCSFEEYTVTGKSAVSPSELGLAVSISSQINAPVQVQLWGEDETQRWCFQGHLNDEGNTVKAYLPFDDFRTDCENNEGEVYDGSLISSVVFVVVGEEESTPYNFCVHGFIETSDDPTDPQHPHDWQGTIGGEGGEDANYDRKMVTVDGEEYIIQNNYGGKESGYQELVFSNNGFEIVHFSGSSQSAGKNISFPSIYIGQNGAKSLNTSNTDNLPARISDISSANTTFKWTGTDLSDSNVAYDIWFSVDNPPYSEKEYGDAVSGVAMLWLHKPSGRQPYGSDTDVDAVFCNVMWNVWVGQPGSNPEFPDLDPNRPVVSYVAQGGDVMNFECDLKEMMYDASFQSYISSNWYLTDIFAGFEIWGGNPTGSEVNEFTIEIQK